MSDLRSRIKNHGVFAELENGTRATIQAQENASSTDLREDIDRLRAVIEFAHSVLEQSDPLYLSPQILEDIRTHAKGVRGELNQYNSNKNATHIQNANQRCDQLLAFLKGLPLPVRQIGVDQYVSTFEEFRKTVYGYLDEAAKKVGQLTSDVDANSRRLKEMADDIVQQRPRLDAAIAEFQKQFSASQAARQSEFAASEKSRLEASAELLKKTTESHAIESADRQAKFDGWHSEATKKVSELFEKWRTEAKGQIDQIGELKSEAEKIVGLIGEHGMVHGYQTQANSARNAFRFWSGTAVVSLLCWIVFGLVAFLYTYDRELTWATVARQFLVSTPFLLLATFGGYQAFVHQRTASLLRQRELEIASLEPFLASLTRAESNEVKKEMVARFFGQSHSENVPPPPDFAATALGIIDRLTAGAGKK